MERNERGTFCSVPPTKCNNITRRSLLCIWHAGQTQPEEGLRCEIIGSFQEINSPCNSCEINTHEKAWSTPVRSTLMRSLELPEINAHDQLLQVLLKSSWARTTMAVYHLTWRYSNNTTWPLRSNGGLLTDFQLWYCFLVHVHSMNSSELGCASSVVATVKELRCAYWN